ncbi:hypothetical protein ABD76_06080 [Paenibacillus dendritiformis]|uniref:YwiC-like family protein n=1 Tax=Paenibacillus dendritiformis TaxID=130049 RepID=UPI0018CFDD63|nr:YwiC-like family protein [Paenibacillus dendritiformis]MBG9792092.1 hypothetical protein [Paenibacillus dendritiformis]
MSKERPNRRSKLLRAYIPNQHGAWAMLIIPFAAGMFASKPQAIHAWLGIAWLAAYCGSFAGLQWIKTGRASVYRGPVIVYGGACALAGTAVLVMRPDIWWMGAVMLPLLVLNAAFAKRNRERHLLNDFLAVLQFCWMLPIAFEAGGGTDWSLAWRAFAACLLYFAGTIFYVKTMIREKGSRLYYGLSVGVHIVAAAAVGLMLPLWAALPFVALFLRAVWMPGRKVTIKQVGIAEIVFSIVTAIPLIAVVTP